MNEQSNSELTQEEKKTQKDAERLERRFKRSLQQELLVFLGFGVLWCFFASFPMILTKSFYFYSPEWWQNFLFLVGPYTIYLLFVGFNRLYQALQMAAKVSENPNAPAMARFLSTEVTFFFVFWLAWSVFVSTPMALLQHMFEESHWQANLFLFLAPALIYLTGRVLMLSFAYIVASPKEVNK